MPKITKQMMSPKKKPPGIQDAWDMTEHMSVLLYGASGTGKTTFWATFPGPIFAIVVSGGKLSGELRSINTAEYRKKITARICSNADQVLDQVAEAQDGGYKTIVLDHGTGLQEALLRDELGLDTIQLQKSFGFGGGMKDAYQAMALKTKEILFKLLSLDMNRVIISQEKNHNEAYEGDDALLAPVIGAAFSKSVITWLNPACDYVLQTFKRPKYIVKEKILLPSKKVVKSRVKVEGKVEYCLRCEPHETYITKFRTPMGHILPDVIINPTYEKLRLVIDGEQV